MNEARLSAEAVRDLEEIWYRIARRGSAERARRWTSKILKRIRTLAPNPKAGVESDDLEPGSRKIVEGEYLIYYKPSEYGVIISRVIHGRRDQRRALGNRGE